MLDKEYRRKWRASHKEAVYFSHIKHQYGLTLDGYHALIEKQNERCAICQEVIQPMARRTHIDHDHATNKVRGILCHRCNQGLGMFGESPDTLKVAEAYLRRK